MEKQTKNIINLEELEKEMREAERRTLRLLLGWGTALAVLFCTPLAVFLCYQMRGAIEAQTFRVIACAFLVVLSFSPVIPIIAFCVRSLLAERGRSKGGDLVVTVVPLQYKYEDFVRKHLEWRLDFGSFGNVSVDRTEYQLATRGEEYYIVHYRGERTIARFYSTKRYEYRNDSEEKQ